MKRLIIAALLLAGTFVGANAQNLKFYGFIRNYAFMDTKSDNKAGTGDIFYYMPNDGAKDNPNFHYTAITSRLGLDVTDYEFEGLKMGAKIEADFYNGLNGVTGTAVFRLRQAFLTVSNGTTTFKAGQAWHPMAVDMPDVISLNTGAPFGPFARTPLAQFESSLSNNLSLTGALVWQMQYPSAGPEGASANYLKYSGIPEAYLGFNYTEGGFLGRFGASVLNIRPYDGGKLNTEFMVFAFLQYKKDLFSVKFKTAFAEDGSHVNLNGGYGVKSIGNGATTDYEFTPTRNSSSWISLSYGKRVQAVLFGGFVKNFGTADPLVLNQIWFYKNSNSNMNAMYRVSPQILYNLGKLTLALEWERTGVLYGDTLNLNTGLYDQDLHWTVNNRIQAMVKFTF